MNKKQIAVVVIVIGFMGYLYSLPVKGLIKPKETRTTTSGVASVTNKNATITVASVSALATSLIDPAFAKQISVLETKLKTVGGADKISIQRQLATKWDNVSQAAPSAFYYMDIAHASNAIADWLKAGSRFNAAYKVTQDSVAQGAFNANAVEAFEHATKLQPNNLEAKTGMGVAYVNGGAMPMQGITLLLEVVKQEPKNHEALLNLGMFSMKSGQYAKAVERFKTLIAIKEEVEPYFYLAESYKQLGQKQEAIAAYEKCKQLMGDPAAGHRIDEYIKELKK